MGERKGTEIFVEPPGLRKRRYSGDRKKGTVWNLRHILKKGRKERKKKNRPVRKSLKGDGKKKKKGGEGKDVTVHAPRKDRGKKTNFALFSSFDWNAENCPDRKGGEGERGKNTSVSCLAVNRKQRREKRERNPRESVERSAGERKKKERELYSTPKEKRED